MSSANLYLSLINDPVKFGLALFLIIFQQCLTAGQILLPVEGLVGFELDGDGGDIDGGEPVIGRAGDRVTGKGFDRRVTRASGVNIHDRERLGENACLAGGGVDGISLTVPKNDRRRFIF